MVVEWWSSLSLSAVTMSTSPSAASTSFCGVSDCILNENIIIIIIITNYKREFLAQFVRLCKTFNGDILQ